MRYFTEITQITKEEAYAETGTGNWGVKLTGDNKVAWACPMLGHGGEGDYDQLGVVLAQYNLADSADPLYVEDGPDEILYRIGDTYFLMIITVE
jgi:hypothetical protein